MNPEMKKKIVALSVIMLCLAVLGTGTLAYFSDSAVAHNVITAGGVKIRLQEWADTEKTEPFPEEEGISGVMPGEAVTKIVEVKNTGVSDAWVRIRLTKTAALVNAAAGFAPDLELMELDINTREWTRRSENGVVYYYYNLPLAPGKTTVPLFTTVTFDGADMDNTYCNSRFEIDVMAYAVQVANNGTSALTAAGWPSDTP